MRCKTNKKQSAVGRIRTHATFSEPTARNIIDLVLIWWHPKNNDYGLLPSMTLSEVKKYTKTFIRHVVILRYLPYEILRCDTHMYTYTNARNCRHKVVIFFRLITRMKEILLFTINFVLFRRVMWWSLCPQIKFLLKWNMTIFIGNGHRNPPASKFSLLLYLGPQSLRSWDDERMLIPKFWKAVIRYF